jgi:hypothetical protein
LQRFVSSLMSLLCFIALIGCGNRNGRDYQVKPEEQATITGTVKFGNKNVPINATVTFFNADKGIAAIGFADESGKFTCNPVEKETGLPAGRYVVTVTPPLPPPLSEEEYKKMEANAMAMPNKTYKELPTKFYNSLTSGLAFDVKPGANSFDIDLAN